MYLDEDGQKNALEPKILGDTWDTLKPKTQTSLGASEAPERFTTCQYSKTTTPKR
jgi:hypothetical protein